MTEPVLNETFTQKQAALLEQAKTDPLVSVFTLSTHGGANTIAEDAERKVAAMHAGGIRNIELLLRGDDSVKDKSDPRYLTVDQFIDASLAAISALKKNPKYHDMAFGVGTVSSADMQVHENDRNDGKGWSTERLQRVIDNPDVSFVVTAHWPGSDWIKKVRDSGKVMIPTVSKTDKLRVDEQKALFSETGTDELVPERIKEARALGVKVVKIFDFGKTAEKRLQGMDAKDDAMKVAGGLVAVAEALEASFGGNVPDGETFTVMTTGGVLKNNLGYLAAGAKDPKVREAILKIYGGDTTRSTAIIDLLKNTTVLVGGTYITKEYDANPTADTAMQNLEQLSRDSHIIARNGAKGVVNTLQR